MHPVRLLVGISRDMLTCEFPGYLESVSSGGPLVQGSIVYGRPHQRSLSRKLASIRSWMISSTCEPIKDFMEW